MRKLFLLSVLGLIVCVIWGGSMMEARAEKPFEGKRIRVLADQRSEIVKLKELAPQFEEETGMKVDFIITGDAPLDEKASLELTAPKTNLDVTFLKFFLGQDYARRGYLAAFDDLLSGPDALQHFSESALNIARYEGKIYGVPLMMEPNILTYRADLFAKHGISVPNTMDELMEAARIITEKEDGVYGIVARGHRRGRPNWDWSSFLRAWGGNYLDENGNPAINSEAAVKSLEAYTKLLTSYGPPGVADYNWQDVQDDMAAGKVAIMYDAISLSVRLAKPKDPNYSKFSDKLSFAVVPEGPAGRESGFFSWLFVIPKNSKEENKEAAMAFIEWSFTPEIAKKVGWGAAAEDVFNAPAYPDYEGSKPLFEVYREALKYSSPDYRPLLPELPQVMDIVDLAINSSLAGLKTPKEALDQAQEELEALLKK